MKPKQAGQGFLIAELVVFILVAIAIGLGKALLLAIVTSLIGAFILRQHFSSVIQHMQTMHQTGKPLEINEFAQPLMVIAGIMLFLPGFITDFLGVLCLIPGLQRYLQKLLQRFNLVQTDSATNHNSQSEQTTNRQGRIIEGEFTREPTNQNNNQDNN
ncbi:MAG: membrane protein FxsA [Gammaproteobacteria bacterium]